MKKQSPHTRQRITKLCDPGNIFFAKVDTSIFCIPSLAVNEQDVFYITKSAKTGYPDTDNIFHTPNLCKIKYMPQWTSFCSLLEYNTARGYVLIFPAKHESKSRPKRANRIYR
jgi:hypothetical protein